MRIGATARAPWMGRSPLSGAMSDIDLAALTVAAASAESKTKSVSFMSPPANISGYARNTYSPSQTAELQDNLKSSKPDEIAILSNPFEHGRLRAEPSANLDVIHRTAYAEVCAAAGVPSVLLTGGGDGNAAKEAYRRLCRATIEPLGRLLATEASRKLDTEVKITFERLRASDIAMSARAYAGLVGVNVDPEIALHLSGLADE